MKTLGMILIGILSTTAFANADKMIVKEWDLVFPSEEAYLKYKLEEKQINRNKATDLIINTIGARVRDVWSPANRMKLTYCVSNTFGQRKKDVLLAVKSATEDWMAHANVKFIHLPTEDARCSNTNTRVMFDVQPATNGGFLASAFFPSTPRAQRILKIDASSFKYPFSSIVGFLRHELGHALGFRHEHISPQGNRQCIIGEGTNFSPLTKYDQVSVMHYPQCGGKNDIRNMVLSELDKQGAAQVYP